MTEDKKRDIISTVKANWPWMPFYRDEHQISLLDYYLSSQIREFETERENHKKSWWDWKLNG